MTDVLVDFQAKFRIPELIIERFSFWNWSVRPIQCTLGAGVLSLARPCTSFGALERDEAAELAHIVREIEARSTAAFRPDRFNYLMLMMVDPQLHFHVVPRYASSREFCALQWQDAQWPAVPVITESAQPAGPSELAAIGDALTRRSARGAT